MKISLQFILIVVLGILTISSCGKRRPPLPPLEKIPQRTEQLNGYQQGNRIILYFPAPQQNAPDNSVQSIRRVDVYRMAESQNSPIGLTEDEFSARSVLIGSIPSDEILKSTDYLRYTDSLEQNGQLVRLRYAVKFVNPEGSRAAFSNFLLIEPTPNISLSPSNLTAEQTEESVLLKWNPPSQNIDTSQPANILGYNIVRQTHTSKSQVKEEVLNKQPVTSANYNDTSFRFNETYTYFVRAVSLGGDGNSIESLESNSITVEPKDTYPPTAPTGISTAASLGKISLFFPNNPEKDIAGYLIYRTENANQPLTRWTKITSEPIIKTTFQDSNVESGKKYFYYIVAIDIHGNTSKPSEIASETAQ